MKGICFKEPLFLSTIEGTKTETRRIAKGKPRYKVWETVYLKEPYMDDFSMDRVFYKYSKADIEDLKAYGYGEELKEKGFWKNKLFMPGSAARYFIKITQGRVERLQDITEEACLREGITVGRCGNEGNWMKAYYAPGDKQPYMTARSAYEELIKSINGKSTWDDNPEVHVYRYELVEMTTFG